MRSRTAPSRIHKRTKRAKTLRELHKRKNLIKSIVNDILNRVESETFQEASEESKFKYDEYNWVNQSSDYEMENNVEVFIKEEPTEQENLVNWNTESGLEIIKEELTDYGNSESNMQITSEVIIKEESLECSSERLEVAGNTSDHCTATMGMECLNKNLENFPRSKNISDYPTIELPIRIKKKSRYKKSSNNNCSLCDFKTTYKSTLKVHLRTHTGEKPYVCRFCDFKSAYKNALLDHLKIHTGEKPHVCEFCGFKYIQKKNLENHLRTHTGEKPYGCDVCDFKSSRNDVLQTHLKTHSTERPFACHICNFKSTRNDILQNHLRTHTGEKPYTCHNCNFKTAHKYRLQVHIKMHPDKIVYECKSCDYISEKRKHYQCHLKTHVPKKQYLHL